jgi:hypothetical protein
MDEEETAMRFHFPVTLYRGSTRQGQITFRSTFINEASDYTCEPEGILVCEKAQALFRQIRQSPLSETGVIGDYVWQVG